MKDVKVARHVKRWTTPTLAYRGTVGQVLKEGGGKLSITGSDSGEMRCEKPHAADCA